MGLTTIEAYESGNVTGERPMVFLFCNEEMAPLPCGGFDTVAEAGAFANWAVGRWNGRPWKCVTRPGTSLHREAVNDARSVPCLREYRDCWLSTDRPGYDAEADPDA